MTPHELNLHIMADNETAKQKHDDLMVQAYLTAYWGRVKKMPSLKELVGTDAKPEKEQTAEDMLVQIKKLNATLGGTTI